MPAGNTVLEHPSDRLIIRPGDKPAMNSQMDEQLWTPGRILGQMAQERPEETVLICAREDGREDCLSRAEFDTWSNRLAHRLAESGLGQGMFVAIILPTCIEHFVATAAAHKLGACPMPVNVRMPPTERDALLDLAQPAAVFSDLPDLNGISRAQMTQLEHYPSTAPEDAVPQPFKAVASGGSTGRPKLIVSPGALAYPRGAHPFAPMLRIEENDLWYSPGPLYHNAPFLFSMLNLFQGGRVMINERFHADRALDLIERYHPDVLNLVPTMMQRMLREPDIESRNFDSVRVLWHLAAPCPAWAKEAWIDLLGPERVWELWAATEITGVTTISGTQWQQRRGSVGQGFMTEIRILDQEGNACRTGDVGEIWTRFAQAPPQYSYLGSEPMPLTDDGFCSVGDLGYVDEEEYLYLSDRRVDLIISGGANIYPAEVEAVISAHPAVRDVAVVGLKDPDLGRRVHAIVEPRDSGDPPSFSELDALCREKLSRYKTPRSYETIERLPRNQAGKIRRSTLRDERDS
jgi:bile acid-coenzyme A ligase